MSKYLGPLSSSGTGIQIFYVDITPQLNTNELASSLNSVVSSDSRVSFSGAQLLTGNYTTIDGHVLYAYKGIKFTAIASGSANLLNTVTVDYSTDMGNENSTIVYIQVRPSI